MAPQQRLDPVKQRLVPIAGPREEGRSFGGRQRHCLGKYLLSPFAQLTHGRGKLEV